MKKIEKILLATIVAIILIIIFGTAVAFVSGTATPSKNLTKQETYPDNITKEPTNATSYYSQIGTIRCSTQDNPSIALVVETIFEYPTNDTTFYEEIFRKNQKLRLSITNYFNSYTKQALLDMGEIHIKNDLIALINTDLVLGKIEKLYLTEYIFLE